MAKFNVHVFPIVRVKVANIEADSMESAIEQAERAFHIREESDNLKLRVDAMTNMQNRTPFEVEEFEWAEETSHYLVDELKEIKAPGHPDDGKLEIDYDNTQWFNAKGKQTLFNEREELKHDLERIQSLLMRYVSMDNIGELNGAIRSALEHLEAL